MNQFIKGQAGLVEGLDGGDGAFGHLQQPGGSGKILPIDGHPAQPGTEDTQIGRGFGLQGAKVQAGSIQGSPGLDQFFGIQREGCQAFQLGQVGPQAIDEGDDAGCFDPGKDECQGQDQSGQAKDEKAGLAVTFTYPPAPLPKGRGNCI